MKLVFTIGFESCFECERTTWPFEQCATIEVKSVKYTICSHCCADFVKALTKEIKEELAQKLVNRTLEGL